MNFENKIKDKNTDKRAVTKEIAEFAANWLLQYILIMDKKYTGFFNEKGLK